MGLSLDLELLNQRPDGEEGNGEESFRFSSLLDYVNRLEEERRKICVFKRELPLCMILLDNVILKLKEEAKATDSVTKVDDDGNGGFRFLVRKARCDDQTPNQEGDYRKKNSGFRPWKADASGEVASKMTELSLASSVSAVPELGTCDFAPRICKAEKKRQQEQRQVQGCKKKRRCWSPELHKRFVSALEQLGGCHVATPKQIRELMHLDGLSNDEVKSHLQKYRLHLQKHSSFPSRKNALWSMNDAPNDQLNHLSSREEAFDLPRGATDVSSSTSQSLETRSDDRSDSERCC